ncbi:MAG: SDR family oxidoreductase [Spirochaetota bacterium]
MWVDLKNKTAVVTGASRGIGKSISLALADCGAQIVLAARNPENLEKTAQEIISRGGKAQAIPADISIHQDVVSLFSAVGDKWGNVDILVNNAGYASSGYLVDYPVEELDKTIQVNVRGTYLCCREALNLMIPAKTGYIINISSVVGFKGYPNQSAYTASKHAIVGITKSLAAEVQEHNIRVSVIMPGGVETDFTVRTRPDLDPSVLISPDDIAKTVLYLLSLSDRAMVDQVYVRRMASKPF